EAGNLNQWTNPSGTHTYAITSQDPAIGSFALEQKAGGGHFQGLIGNFPTTPPERISWKVKVTSTVASGYVVIGNQSNFSLGVIFSLIENGHMRFVSNNGEKRIPITMNTWIHVELNNFNWTDKTFDIYIDDILQHSSFPFRDTASDVNQVHLYNFQSATAYYDEIVIGDCAVEAICRDVELELDANGSVQLTPEQVYAGVTCGVASLSLSQTIFDASHLGDNLITLTVTGKNGDIVTCTANVKVTDKLAPSISCQPTIEMAADPGICGAVVSFGDGELYGTFNGTSLGKYSP